MMRDEVERPEQEAEPMSEAELSEMVAQDGDLTAEQELEREAVLDRRISKAKKFR